MKRLKKRWYAFTLISIIIALFIMVAYNYAVFHSNDVKNIEDIGSTNLALVAEELEAYLDRGMNVVQTTTASVEYMIENNASNQEIEDFLVYKSKLYQKDIDKNFTGIYGLFNDEYIDGIGWVPDAGYDPTTRDWYTVAVEGKGIPSLVSPYVDAQTNTVMVSISKLLSDNKSVLSLDITMDRIQEITESINLNNIGYGFVMDNNGLVVAHKNIEEKGKNYLTNDSNMKSLLMQLTNTQKCFQCDLNGETVTVFSDTVMNNWKVVMIVNNDALFAESQSTLQRNIVVCSAISFLIISFFVITFIRTNQSLGREYESNRKIEEMNQKIIRALVRTIDAKDRYTNGHSIRVAEYSKEIAKRMKKSEKEQNDIYYAGLLHDVGKIRIPVSIINKPGKLTDEEYEQIKVHPITSYHILKDIYDDKHIALGAKFHHERFDGKGYPNGLKGDNIPEIARIIGVADTYDAMASNRSYRNALPQDVIRSEIEKGRGTQFDPDIANIMLQMIDEDKSYTLKETKSLQKRVLIVDDEPMNIKMIELIMKDEPMYEIIGACSGKEALSILENQEINLILLDLIMPEMDGFEALSLIKEQYNIPVVFMTGDKNIETLEKAAEHGVEDYLTKPFLPLALKEIMHSISN